MSHGPSYGSLLLFFLLACGLLVAALWAITLASRVLAARRNALLTEALRRLECESGKRRWLEAQREGFSTACRDVLAVSDLEGRIQLINPAFEQILGCRPEDAVGRRWLDFVHPDDHERTLADLASLAAGTTTVPLDNRCLRRDGTVRWLQWSSHADLEAGLIFASGRDVTEAHAVRVELVRSNAELEQFAYVASHDLQEPLRTITSYVQLLERRYRDALDDDARDYIDFAVDGARRMQQLIDDLLTYSRLGTRSREAEPTELEDVLAEVEAGLARAIRESGATITHDPLPRLLADPTQLGQLVQNLVGNAIKFHGPAPPRVHLSARAEGAGHVVSVEDHGIGIEPRHFERIFGVFQRLHPRDRYPGTGIGLAVSKRIVERHGGRIWVESEPGRTVFSFWLPDGVETTRSGEVAHERAGA